MVKACGIVPYKFYKNKILIYVYKNKEGKCLFF